VIAKSNQKSYEVVSIAKSFVEWTNIHNLRRYLLHGYGYDPGFYGCALTCALYVTLTKKVYPGGDAKVLTKLYLAELLFG